MVLILGFNWPRCYKKISCSTQLSMKLFLIVNVKMSTVVAILTFTSRNNSILGSSELEKCCKMLSCLIFLY